jgi:anti-sigma B factor antagonist
MAAQLAIAETRVGGVTVLALSGRLVADEEDLVFADYVDGLVADGRIHIVVDFHDVTCIDSGGVGTLVAKFLSVRRRGGDIRLIRVTDRTRRVLAITRLLSVFQVFESAEEAIRSFSVDVPRLPTEAAVP